VSPFSDTLMDHFQRPRNVGPLDGPCVIGVSSLHGVAPRMRIWLDVRCDVVARAGFQAFGCGVSIACASVLTELVLVQDAAMLTAEQVRIALDGVPEEKGFCVDLAISALRDALNQHSANQRGGATGG
jgi:nitrogen fixation protein NifU and related proteins